MNTDDNKAILEELVMLLDKTRETNQQDRAVMILDLFVKRKYHQPVSATGEVKTRVTFRQYWGPGRPTTEMYIAERAWKAALDSIVSMGENLEQVGWYTGEGIYGMGADPEAYWRPVFVRPLRQTVELTVEQKFHALIEKLAGGPPPYESTEPLTKAIEEYGKLQANGKTLDELCAQYGVETKRSV